MVSRSEIEFEKQMLQEKKKRFENVVLHASKTLGLPKPPKVKFWEGYCPHGAGNDELAHIHWDKGIICVSESMLKRMSYEKIEETATHEVTHMLEHSHDENFYIRMDKTMQADWEPKGVTLEGKDEEDEKESKNKPKEDKKRCNYHLCRKETTLKKCPYCGGYFCNEHISPKLPLTYEMVDSERSPTLARIYEGEWRKKGGHPDAVYSEYKLNKIAREEKELTDRIMEALDRMKKSIPTERYEPSEEPKAEPIFRIPTKIVAAIILLIIFGFVIFTYNKEIMSLPFFSSLVKGTCIANYTKAYESGASFGKDPSAYCKSTCLEKYNSTVYNLIEPNQTYKMTACYCDLNNCNH